MTDAPACPWATLQFKVRLNLARTDPSTLLNTLRDVLAHNSEDASDAVKSIEDWMSKSTDKRSDISALVEAGVVGELVKLARDDSDSFLCVRVLNTLCDMEKVNPAACFQPLLAANNDLLHLAALSEARLMREAASHLLCRVIDAASRHVRGKQPAQGAAQDDNIQLALTNFIPAYFALAGDAGAADAVSRLFPLAAKALRALSKLAEHADAPPPLRTLDRVVTDSMVSAVRLLQIHADKSGLWAEYNHTHVAKLALLLPRTIEKRGLAAVGIRDNLYREAVYTNLVPVIPSVKYPAAALALADVIVNGSLHAQQCNVLMAQLVAEPEALMKLVHFATTLSHGSERALLAKLLEKVLNSSMVQANPSIMLLDADFLFAEFVFGLGPSHRSVDKVIHKWTRGNSASWAAAQATLQHPLPRHSLPAVVSLAALLGSARRQECVLALQLTQGNHLEHLVDAILAGNDQRVVLTALSTVLKQANLQSTTSLIAPAGGAKRKSPAFVNEPRNDTTQLTLENGAVSFHVDIAAVAPHSKVLHDLFATETEMEAPSSGPFALDGLLQSLPDGVSPSAGLTAAMEWAHNGGLAPAGFLEDQGVTLPALYAVAHALQMDTLLVWCVARMPPKLDAMRPSKLKECWELGYRLPTLGEPLQKACAGAWLRRVAVANERDASVLFDVLCQVFVGQDRIAAAMLVDLLRTALQQRLPAAN